MSRSGSAPRKGSATADQLSFPGFFGPSDSSRRPPPTERGGFVLNLPSPDRDQGPAPSRGAQVRGNISMKSVRPDNTDPIPLRASPPHMGTIMIRCVGLLLAAVVVLALIWSR